MFPRLVLGVTLVVAATAAAQDPPPSPAAEKRLRDALTDPSPDVRATALKSLAKRPPSAGLRPEVVRLMKAADVPPVAGEATKVLVAWQDVDAFVPLLDDPNWFVRWVATQGLGQIDPKGSDAVRAKLAAALPKLEARTDPAVEPEAPVRLYAAWAAFEIGRDEDGYVLFLTQFLNDPGLSSAGRRQGLALAAGTLKAKAAPLLVRALDGKDAALAVQAAHLAGQLGKDGRAAVPALVRRLNPDAPPLQDGVHWPERRMTPDVCVYLTALVAVDKGGKCDEAVLAVRRAADSLDRVTSPLNRRAARNAANGQELDAGMTPAEALLLRNGQGWLGAYAQYQEYLADRLAEIDRQRP